MKLQNLNKEWQSKWQIRPHRIYKLCVTQIFQAYLENFHFSINPALKLEVGFKQVTCFKRSIPTFDQRSKSDQGILEAERSAGQPWKLVGKCVGRTAYHSPARPVNEQRSWLSQLIKFPRHQDNRWWSCDTYSSVRRQVSTSHIIRWNIWLRNRLMQSQLNTVALHVNTHKNKACFTWYALFHINPGQAELLRPLSHHHLLRWPTAETQHGWFVSPPPQRALRQWFMGPIHLHLTF